MVMEDLKSTSKKMVGKREKNKRRRKMEGRKWSKPAESERQSEKIKT